MDMEVAEKPSLKLTNPVVRRVVPMTSKGCDLLRAARDHIVDDFYERTGNAYNVPFPVVIHMALVDYCKNKGIEPNVAPNTSYD